jgi:type VI protein secretion system component VasK
MQSLHPRLIGFLEGLYAASVTRYPEYGMFLRGPYFGSAVRSQPSAAKTATMDELRQFFLCALSDTAAARPHEAAHVVVFLSRLVGVLIHLLIRAQERGAKTRALNSRATSCIIV